MNEREKASRLPLIPLEDADAALQAALAQPHVIAAAQRIRDSAGGLRLPLLILQVTGDRVIDPQGARELHTQAASTDKTRLFAEVRAEARDQGARGDAAPAGLPFRAKRAALARAEAARALSLAEPAHTPSHLRLNHQ